MIPKKIRAHFMEKTRKQTDEITLIEGIVSCCSVSRFDVDGVGGIQYGLFSKMYLLPTNDTLALVVRCKVCGKSIPIFDSSCDGYEPRNMVIHPRASAKSIACKKCSGQDFSVELKYEYPDEHELIQLMPSRSDNAFTWIWVTLKCNGCSATYKNFVDFETA